MKRSIIKSTVLLGAVLAVVTPVQGMNFVRSAVRGSWRRTAQAVTQGARRALWGAEAEVAEATVARGARGHAQRATRNSWLSRFEQPAGQVVRTAGHVARDEARTALVTVPAKRSTILVTVPTAALRNPQFWATARAVLARSGLHVANRLKCAYELSLSRPGMVAFAVPVAHEALENFVIAPARQYALTLKQGNVRPEVQQLTLTDVTPVTQSPRIEILPEERGEVVEAQASSRRQEASNFAKATADTMADRQDEQEVVARPLPRVPRALPARPGRWKRFCYAVKRKYKAGKRKLKAVKKKLMCCCGGDQNDYERL